LRLLLLCGGRSGEHEISLLSAASVYAALDRRRFEVLVVGITREEGLWLLLSSPEDTFREGLKASSGQPVVLGRDRDGPLLLSLDGSWSERVEVAFPLLHGPNGEDGTLQGLLEMSGLPYVGCGVLSSALSMDKGMAKDVLVRHGLPVAPYLVFRSREWEEDPEGISTRVEVELGYPVFVKPCNLGSSVGISRAGDREELGRAVAGAALYDRRIIVERAIQAREIEVSVLGNELPLTSVPGEVVPRREFYDYVAKYRDPSTGLLIPAPLTPEEAERARELARAAYQALDCAGMARVDLFLDRESGNLYINELNTIPGFTAVSMYPKLWEASGLPYPELLSRLVELALERWQERSRLRLTPGD